MVLLADWCNECGNCTTFCPTSGAPYRDKLRLYLDRGEFEAQTDNAFMVFNDEGDWAMEARFGASTHRIRLGQRLSYTGPSFAAQIDSATFDLLNIELKEGQSGQERLSLEPAATMYVLLKGIKQSMAHLPQGSSTKCADAGPVAPANYPE